MKKKILSGLIAVAMVASIVSCSSNKNATAANGQPNGGAPSTEELFAQMDS